MSQPLSAQSKELEEKASKLLNSFLEEKRKDYYGKIAGLDSAKTILSSSPEQQVAVLMAAASRISSRNSRHGLKDILADPDKFEALFQNPRQSFALVADSTPGGYADDRATKNLMALMCKRPLPLSEEQIVFLVQCKITEFFIGLSGDAEERYSDVVSCAETFAKTNTIGKALNDALNIYVTCISKMQFGHHSAGPSSTSRKVIHRIQLITRAGGGNGEMSNPIAPEDAWAELAIADIRSMNDTERRDWLSLLNTCSRAQSTKPTQKWVKEAEGLMSRIGDDRFVKFAESWLSCVPKKSTVQHANPWDDEVIKTSNQDILRGLAWCCSLRKDPRLAQALGNAAESCFKKVTYFGPRAPIVANACVYALSQMNTKEAVSQLSRVQVRAKHVSSRAQIDKAMSHAAEQAGMTVEDLQDIGVPDFGFSMNGLRVEQFGDFRAELSIKSDGSLDLQWLNSSGKSQQSVPAAVKKDHAAELKAFKKLLADLEKLLPTISHRIEHSLINQRHWTYATWKERFLEHPICATLARRLVWNFNGNAGIWNEENIVGIDDVAMVIDDSAIVELWHPISVDPQTVLKWRRWLMSHNITQPFKQCHREIYVLTDAERKTKTYSNRFAGHILKQHQLQRLCEQRGWRFTLMGSFDNFNVPTLKLPKWNLGVGFWVDIPEGAGEEVLADTSPVSMIVATDQVRFDRTGEEVPLTEIVPVVFSEVMRDVDLFVSVCSIGTEPQYTGAFGRYWQTYSFGDLSAPAVTRRQTLVDLLPMLKISDRCEIKDKFLVVRGDLRTYKIHLGSGNILMEPNDQYLCIVSSKEMSAHSPKNVFLPFEGDTMLSVILSKAFMLADDSKIKDQVILNQIKPAKT